MPWRRGRAPARSPGPDRTCSRVALSAWPEMLLRTRASCANSGARSVACYQGHRHKLGGAGEPHLWTVQAALRVLWSHPDRAYIFVVRESEPSTLNREDAPCEELPSLSPPQASLWLADAINTDVRSWRHKSPGRSDCLRPTQGFV